MPVFTDSMLMGEIALYPCCDSFVQEFAGRYIGRITGLLAMWVRAVTAPR